MGILLDECTLSETDIVYDVLIQTVSGERIDLALTGEHNDCEDTEFGSSVGMFQVFEYVMVNVLIYLTIGCSSTRRDFVQY